MNKAWQEKHSNYSQQDWINKPSIFAEEALPYLPEQGKLLDLGAGLGQDSCFFAEKGFTVLATDLEPSALESAQKKAVDRGLEIETLQLDLAVKMPFENNTFDVVYAHLALHYFDTATTESLFSEIFRVLKFSGVLAFLVNSVNDPEYGQGEVIESDYYKLGAMAKRYFSSETAGKFTHEFRTKLLDESGETYKDITKGVHGLVRYIGIKPLTRK